MSKSSICIGVIIYLSIIFILLFLYINNTYALTSLNYRLYHSGNSNAEISDENSFHGIKSLELDGKGKDKDKNPNAKIVITMDEPMPIDDLNALSMWINPQTGEGSFQIDLNLIDDDTNSPDMKISLQKNLKDMDFQWNELDVFDLEDSNSESLDDYRNKYMGKRISKITITISKGAALIDYIKIGDELISFEPLEKENVKDGPTSATPGGLITYTITYGNNGIEPVDLIVKEDYDPRTVFIESYPPADPGTIDTWTIHNLPPGAHGQIVIKMRSFKPAARARIDGHVSGRGLASKEGMLSTEFESYLVTNNVHILAGEFNFSASATTRIRPIIGSTLAFGEHGAGEYQTEEQLTYSSVSIKAERSILASSYPVFVNLSSDFIPLKEDWSANLRAENDYRDIRWSDRYHESKSLNLSYRTQLGKTLTSLETTAQIMGLADRTACWPGGFYDTRLAGNFTLAGNVRWRWANKTVSPNKEWLECCPLGQE